MSNVSQCGPVKVGLVEQNLCGCNSEASQFMEKKRVPNARSSRAQTSRSDPNLHPLKQISCARRVHFRDGRLPSGDDCIVV